MNRELGKFETKPCNATRNTGDKHIVQASKRLIKEDLKGIIFQINEIIFSVTAALVKTLDAACKLPNM